MRGHIVTVTLNPAIDEFVASGGARCQASTQARRQASPQADRQASPKAGRQASPQADRIVAGGKGVNCGRALKILGLEVVATGCAGGEAGRRLEAALAKEGIPHDFVRIRGETRTNVTVIGRGAACRRIEPGPAVSPEEFRALEERFASLVEGSAFAVFSGSLPPGVPPDAYRALVGIAAGRGVPAALDTSGAALAEALARREASPKAGRQARREASPKARPRIVKVNLDEASLFAGERLGPLAGMPRALCALRPPGVGIAVITMGPRGAVAWDGRDAVLAVPPRVGARSTVGCGDAFLAALIAAHLGGGARLCDALAFAVAAGAASCRTLCPGSFALRDACRIAGQVRRNILPMRPEKW